MDKQARKKAHTQTSSKHGRTIHMVNNEQMVQAKTAKYLCLDCAGSRVPAWLAKNPATFGQHFPEIGWDSAKTKGTVLLSILPRSCRTQWLKLMIKILPLAQPAAHTPPAPVREATQKTQRKRSPSSAARSEAHAASRCRRARSTAVHGGAELAVAALAGASGVNHGDMLRDFGQRGGLTLRRSPHEVHAPA